MLSSRPRDGCPVTWSMARMARCLGLGGQASACGRLIVLKIRRPRTNDPSLRGLTARSFWGVGVRRAWRAALDSLRAYLPRTCGNPVTARPATGRAARTYNLRARVMQCLTPERNFVAYPCRPSSGKDRHHVSHCKLPAPKRHRPLRPQSTLGKPSNAPVPAEGADDHAGACGTCVTEATLSQGHSLEERMTTYALTSAASDRVRSAAVSFIAQTRPPLRHGNHAGEQGLSARVMGIWRLCHIASSPAAEDRCPIGTLLRGAVGCRKKLCLPGGQRFSPQWPTRHETIRRP